MCDICVVVILCRPPEYITFWVSPLIGCWVHFDHKLVIQTIMNAFPVNILSIGVHCTLGQWSKPSNLRWENIFVGTIVPLPKEKQNYYSKANLEPQDAPVEQVLGGWFAAIGLPKTGNISFTGGNVFLLHIQPIRVHYAIWCYMIKVSVKQKMSDSSPF